MHCLNICRFRDFKQTRSIELFGQSQFLKVSKQTRSIELFRQSLWEASLYRGLIGTGFTFVASQFLMKSNYAVRPSR